MFDEPVKRISVDLPTSMKEEIARLGLPYRAIISRGLETIKNSGTINDEITELNRVQGNFYKQLQGLVEQMHELRRRVKNIEELSIIARANEELEKKKEELNGSS